MVEKIQHLLSRMFEASGRQPMVKGVPVSLEFATDASAGMAMFAYPVFALHSSIQAPPGWLGPVVLNADADSVVGHRVCDNPADSQKPGLGYPVMGLFALSFDVSCQVADMRGEHDTLDLEIPLRLSEEPLAFLGHAVSLAPERRKNQDQDAMDLSLD